MAEKKRVNLKLQQTRVNQIFNPHAFVFFLLTGATRYYHAIYIVFTCLEGYEDDIFEFFFKFAHSSIQIWWKIFLKINHRGVHGVCFFQVCSRVHC